MSEGVVPIMEECVKKAKELASFLASTPTYASYVKAKMKIDAQSDLAFKIKEFKRVQMEYELKILQGVVPSFDEEKYVSKLYSDLQLIEEARGFLDCEQEMITMLDTVNEIIDSACQVNG